MFSFVEDTVLDPFAGTFSSVLAAAQAHRNSIANELDPEYFEKGVDRVMMEVSEQARLFGCIPEIQIS